MRRGSAGRVTEPAEPDRTAEPDADTAPDARPAVDLDAFAAAIDVGRLSEDQFVQLVSTIEMLGVLDAGFELRALRTDTLVTFLAGASRAQIARLMEHPHLRPVVLDEIFHRMSAHLSPKRARGVAAVIHWKLTGSPGADEFDRFQTVIGDGVSTTGTVSTHDPRITVTIDPADFVRAAIGVVSLPMLFLRGRVKVKGDIAFASGLVGYFDLPKPER